jgi:hypothetical protein
MPANARAKPVGEDHFRVNVYKGISIYEHCYLPYLRASLCVVFGRGSNN